jgi:hypothetical protein
MKCITQLCIIQQKFKSWKDTQFYRKIDSYKGQYLLFEDGTVLIFVVQRDM